MYIYIKYTVTVYDISRIGSYNIHTWQTYIVYSTYVSRNSQQLVPGLEYAIMSGGDVAPLEEQAVTELHKLFRCGRLATPIGGFLTWGIHQSPRVKQY